MEEVVILIIVEEEVVDIVESVEQVPPMHQEEAPMVFNRT
jgi:hypothetical protein